MVAQIAFNALNKPVYYHCVLNNHFLYLQRFLFSAKCDAEVERAYNQMEKFKDQNVSRHQATMQRVRLKNYKTKTEIHKNILFLQFWWLVRAWLFLSVLEFY